MLYCNAKAVYVLKQCSENGITLYQVAPYKVFQTTLCLILQSTVYKALINNNTHCLQLQGHLWLWLLSRPGALNNNSPSDHVIDSPVVLEEQQRDEGGEKEGNRKIFVQGSNS